MGKVTTTLRLNENFSSTLRRASGATSAFSKQVSGLARELDKQNRQRRQLRVDASPMLRTIANVKRSASKIMVNVGARVHNFKRDMAPVTKDIKNLVRKPLIITLKLKDMAMAGLRRLSALVRQLARGVTIAIGATGAAGAYIVGKGMALEKYQMSIGHFVGVNNPQMSMERLKAESDAYMAWLSQNAKETPFSTADVIAAGSRAVGVTGGRIDAAKGFVKLAEDMAAMTPGKTVIDAIEALADAQMGEMERLKEFGIKLTQEDLKKAGGDLFYTQSKEGKTLLDVFGGGSKKLAQSGSGKWSTVMGNLEDGLARAGLKLLEALTPLLDWGVEKSDDIGAWFEQIGTDIGTWASKTIPELIPKVTNAWNSLKGLFDSATGWISGKAERLKPFTEFLTGGKGVLGMAGMLLPGKSQFEGILGALDSLVNTLIDALNSIAKNWGTIQPAVSGLIKYLPQLALAFGAFKLIKWGWTTGKAVGNLFSGVGNFFGNLFGKKGASPIAPAQPSVTPEQKPTSASPAAGKSAGGRNTFTGPNYNTFQGTNQDMRPRTIPDSGGFNVPPRGSPLDVPAGGIPVNLPAGGFPVSFPAGGIPINLPAGGFPVSFPAGGIPINIPTGGIPLNLPSGGLPLQLPTGGGFSPPTVLMPPAAKPFGLPGGMPALGLPEVPPVLNLPGATGFGAAAKLPGLALSGSAVGLSAGGTALAGASILGGVVSALYAAYETFFGSKAKETWEGLKKAKDFMTAQPGVKDTLTNPDYWDPESKFNKAGGLSVLWRGPKTAASGRGGKLGLPTETGPIIPDSLIATAKTKWDNFIAALKSKASGALPGWLKSLFGGGSLTANVTINQTVNQALVEPATPGDISIRTSSPGGITPKREKMASGIMRVPYDNYPALLHRGEAVLPSNAAGEYRDAGNRPGGSVSINGMTVNINGANKDGMTLAREFAQGLRLALQNS